MRLHFVQYVFLTQETSSKYLYKQKKNSKVYDLGDFS